jgi:hypothetical protein
MHIVTKICVFILSALLLTAASQNSNPTPLIDTTANPKGLAVPKSFLGLHLNKWNDDTKLGNGDLPMPGEVSIKNGTAYFKSKNGYTFYHYRNGVKVKLVGMGNNGKEFETTISALETPSGQYPTVAKLASVPPITGPGIVKYPSLVPKFGYAAVRSHDTGVNWATLNPADGIYNAELMSAWVARHDGKKIMFTMSGTPEWLAASNISPISRTVSNNLATINHADLSFPLPVGSKIKIRNCNNNALNGEWVISASTTKSTSFKVNKVSENTIADTTTELLLASNAGNYGYMNPPKDFTKVNLFITWLMKNYGKNIDWIEGQNEANSGRTPKGEIWYTQGQGLWWAGSFDQLGEIMRRVNVAAKAIKPEVQIGAPSITGLHNGQPINQGPSNRANGYQLLSAGDGAGGKLIEWVDFVPFHVYDLGAAWQLNVDRRTLYDTLPYLKLMLASEGIKKPNMPIYMNEGGFEQHGNYSSYAKNYFESLGAEQKANEIFKIAAIYAGFGVKGFYPYTLGDYETVPEISKVYDKINKRIAGKTISPDAWFNKETGEMFFKTSDGYIEQIP